MARARTRIVDVITNRLVKSETGYLLLPSPLGLVGFIIISFFFWFLQSAESFHRY
ncbi:uncharacterized protein BDW47DRAFT_100579 [Aspergillus candidus]|uniref:Uncharacterized protein n=1 Tax=Aspergillus candidus TaxID=41067 RepID=A0A2I2FKL7_ASPCN|nr:hypothetical protein BDW47DRAFT_100579 [Aspergillus candidus]PLB41152.1 hypothetical protein BDW47DRAFT_100579 [Aspergillus candidus]